MVTHFDFLDNEIKIGDKVVVMMKSYRELKIGTVIKITPQKVQVAYNDGTYNISIYQLPKQIICTKGFRERS